MSPAAHLHIDILPTQNTLIIRVEERTHDPGSAVSLLETVDVPWDEVDLLSQEIRRHLTSQRQARSVRNRLERAGQLLFDLLFGRQSKEALRRSDASFLTLRLHADLLSLPWELLHDGDQFLSLRFAMGRLVQTEGEAMERPRGLEQGPIPMVIIADPRQDLPSADEEGQQLLDLGFDHEDHIEPNLLPSPTSRRQVLEALKQYPMVHLAGHGEDGGWCLSDGNLLASDIERMRGGSRFPSLIFANACASGSVSQWDPGAKALARTFLLGGSRHFIGACCDLPDRTGLTLALRFYGSLWSGQTIGDALRLGRQSLANDPGLPPLAWAGYVLYGEPSFTYFDRSGPVPIPEPSPHVIIDGRNTSKVQASLTTTGPQTPRAPLHGIQSTAPETGNNHPAPKASLSLGKIPTLFALIIATLCTLFTFVDAFAPVSGLWWNAAHRVRGPQNFNSKMVLLGVSRDVSHRRPLYAQLLEQLAKDQNLSPEVVAFDTWLKAPSEQSPIGPEEKRLFAAIAKALPRFSVVFAQRVQQEQADPPPKWLLEGVEQALKVQCTQCDKADRQLILQRLRFGHVAVHRVSGTPFGEMDHRIPFFCDSPYENRPLPFAYQVAFSQVGHQALCRGGGLSYGVQGESLNIPLDVQGRMPLYYSGAAQWNLKEPRGLAAYDLQALLNSWTRDQLPPLGPDSLAGRMVVVGLAQADAAARDADRRPTVLGEMYGVEVQANAIEQLRQRLSRKPLPVVVQWILYAGLALLCLVLLHQVFAGVMFLALGALIVLLAYLAWSQFAVLASPAAPLLILTTIWVLRALLKSQQATKGTHEC